MSDSWMAKLANQITLSQTDLAALTAGKQKPKAFLPRDVIAAEGDVADTMIIMVSGWAARCKTLRGGERQIVGFLLPGDRTTVYPDLDCRRTDAIWALTPCEVVEAPVDAVANLSRERSAFARALQSGAMLESAISQEWLMNLGQRSAERRVAHLFCELSERLRAIGLATEQRFPLPVTQTTLGDALGLSPAHVNRTLQSLRAADLAVFESASVVIKDPPQLRKFAGFNSCYLNGFVRPNAP